MSTTRCGSSLRPTFARSDNASMPIMPIGASMFHLFDEEIRTILDPLIETDDFVDVRPRPAARIGAAIRRPRSTLRAAFSNPPGRSIRSSEHGSARPRRLPRSPADLVRAHAIHEPARPHLRGCAPLDPGASDRTVCRRASDLQPGLDDDLVDWSMVKPAGSAPSSIRWRRRVSSDPFVPDTACALIARASIAKDDWLASGQNFDYRDRMQHAFDRSPWRETDAPIRADQAKIIDTAEKFA